jgi:cell division protein FtsB
VEGEGETDDADAGALRMMKRSRLLLVGVLGAVLFGHGLWQLASLSWMEYRLDQRLGSLAAERYRLAKEETRLRTNPAYVEGLIRSTFKLARPGEMVVPSTVDVVPIE